MPLKDRIFTGQELCVLNIMFITNNLTNGFSFKKFSKFTSKSKRVKLANDAPKEEILLKSQVQTKNSPTVAKPRSLLARSIVKATAVVPPARKFTSPYEDDETIGAALQLYNKQMETADGTSGSSNIPQKWEYKGEIKVSFQLCVLCHDVGKVKSRRDKYYLDVMEVRKYRTVLCKGCLEKILYKTVGNCPHEIQRRLIELE